MSNLITDWRAAVVTHLQTEFPAAEVLPGVRDGVSRDKDRIGVFWPGWAAVQQDLALANPVLTIRYWPSRSKLPSTTSPPDPEPLEQAAADLMAAFVSKRKSGDFVENLACYIARVTPDYSDDQWLVEATLQALTLNLAVTAG